jgi:hypothetical protein
MTLTPKLKIEIIKIMRERSPRFLAELKRRIKDIKNDNTRINTRLS